LQEQLLDIWRRTGTTVVFITHGIEEAIYLGQRVAVMTSRPGRIKQLVRIELPEAEDVRSTPEFAAQRHQIWQLLRDEITALGSPTGKAA